MYNQRDKGDFMMNTHVYRAYKVSSALVFAAVTTVWLPVSSAYAAPTNPQAPRYGYEKKQPIVVEDPAAQTATTETAVQTEETTSTAVATTVPAATPASGTQTAASQNQKSPSGNNGFIKVNEEVLPDSTPNNDPHVSCTFKVEFYNYDHNPAYQARVTFALQNPTAGDGYALATEGNILPSIGQDGASGGKDLDAVEAYKLTFTGKPHVKQGYHVKLTIHADGSRGADVKHKVFWVQPCKEVGAVAPQGQVLGVSTSMPSQLPSTGSNGLLGLMITSLASLAAYLLTFRLQKSHES